MWWLLPIAFGGRVDRIVAVVDDQVVLDSDRRLADELAAFDPSPVPFWRAREAPQRSIDAAILDAAAGDIALYRPSGRTVDERLEALRARFDDRTSWRGFLTSWGLTEAELRGILRQRLRVEAFLLRNITVRPEDEASFTAATEHLIAELRPRFRVRDIGLEP